MPGTSTATTNLRSARPARRPRVVREVDGLQEVELTLAELRPAPSLRANGLDPDHGTRTAEIADRWPAILVRSCDHTVFDGQHLVDAARKLRITHLRVVLFDGSNDDAYVEFVRRNVGHGLPL